MITLSFVPVGYAQTGDLFTTPEQPQLPRQTHPKKIEKSVTEPEAAPERQAALTILKKRGAGK